MNPALTAALIATSKREEIAEHIEGRLKQASARSITSAIALELNEQEQELLDQALADGTVKRTADGRLYLNEQAIADRNEGQGFMALLMLLVIASVIASAAVLLDKI